jgi:cytosine/adenosine deaminase-related metal-dependent hydrolase
VLAAGGRVLAVGAFPLIRKDGPAGARLIDHGNAALMPALVNAHTHLDLCALKGAIPFPQPGFPNWLGLLFAQRAEIGSETAAKGFDSGLRELRENATVLAGDVTNGSVAASCRVARGGNSPVAFPERHVFLELLGFNLGSVAEALPPGLNVKGGPLSLVPHSVYSASPSIIKGAKEWTHARVLPFSIHAAEHPEEIEFLRSGGGFCRELLERLGRWDPAWTPPGKTPIEYLDDLGALDSRTLLVHAVHMLDSDWDLAARWQCSIVFCPRSNRNMNSGRPDIEKALLKNIQTALGTDSLSSNTDLSLFSEASYVLDNYAAINPERVLEMITLNPARALGREKDFGSIEQGVKADLLAVSIESHIDESDIADALIRSGKEGAWKWVNPAQN